MFGSLRAKVLQVELIRLWAEVIVVKMEKKKKKWGKEGFLIFFAFVVCFFGGWFF